MYLWTAPLSRLTPSIWTFEQFLRESAHRWVGVGAEDNPDYAEVDRRRQMKGVITPRGVQESAEAALEEVDAKLQAEQPARAAPSANGSAAKELASFGRSLRAKYFSHEAEWIPLNHGSSPRSFPATSRPFAHSLARPQARTAQPRLPSSSASGLSKTKPMPRQIGS